MKQNDQKGVLKMLVSTALLLVGLSAEVFSAPNTHAIHTSTFKLENLIRMEQKYIQEVQDVVAKNIQDLLKMYRYLRIYKKTRPHIENPTDYVANPINSFLLVKQMVTDWSPVRSLLDKNIKHLHNIRTTMDSDWELPTEEDLNGAGVALARLQQTYALDLTDFTRGIIGGRQYSSVLTGKDCLKVADQLSKTESQYQALLWALEAERLLDQENNATMNDLNELQNILQSKEGFEKECISLVEDVNNDEKMKMLHKEEDEEDKTMQMEEVIPVKERVLNIVGTSASKLGFHGEVLRVVIALAAMPNRQEVQEAYARKKEELESDIAGKPFNTDGEISPQRPVNTSEERKHDILYEKLCRGQGQIGIEVTSQFHCRYVDRGHPFLRLAPFKEEEVSLDPRIVLIHDAIYDSEIEDIVKQAKTKLFPSLIVEENTDEARTDDLRISSSAVMWESQTVDRLAQRSYLMAGLSGTTPEILQAVNYGIGGLFHLHYDNNFQSAFSGPINVRAATMLYYMSDVEAGGATVFPLAKVAVFPQKGSAVLWYNLHRDGQINLKTLHAGCPVLLGSKWVGNKWFSLSGEETTFPCLLEQDSRKCELRQEKAVNILENLGPKLISVLSNVLKR